MKRVLVFKDKGLLCSGSNIKVDFCLPSGLQELATTALSLLTGNNLSLLNGSQRILLGGGWLSNHFLWWFTTRFPLQKKYEMGSNSARVFLLAPQIVSLISRLRKPAKHGSLSCWIDVSSNQKCIHLLTLFTNCQIGVHWWYLIS